MPPGRDGSALDPGVLVRADRRHRDGLLVGVLHAGLGRLVVLGPGRERLLHALAGRHRADPLVDRGGEARHAEILDHPAGDHHLLPVAGRHLPGPLRRADLGACLRHRSAARDVHPAAAGRGDRRVADAVCRSRAGPEGWRAVRADLA